MKKILSIIALSVFLVCLTAPVLVGGQMELPNGCTITNSGAILDECATVTDVDEFCDFTADKGCGMCCLVNTIYNVTNWLFYLMMAATVLVFVIAAAWFMFAGGDFAKTKKAQGMIILGVVGLVIALIAKLIPSVVKLIVGM